MKNPYQVLHLTQQATFDQIKARYKHLTKLLHPDKQPHNRELAKKYFQDIERAYKSIASPLRMHVFGQYGIAGINLLDQYPSQFIQFQQAELNHQAKTKLRQKIIYILYEQHASAQSEKIKFSTKTVINTNRTFKELERDIPQIQNCDFNIQVPLPEIYKVINSISISQKTSNVPRQAKSQLAFSLTSMKRIRQTYTLIGNISLTEQQTGFQFTVQKMFNPSFVLKFTPINGVYANETLNLALPKIGFEKAFQNVNFSGITDFQNINLEISNSNKSNFYKSLKIVIQPNAFAIIPRIQKSLTNQIKLFAQIMVSGQRSNSLDFRFGLLYGIKVKITDQLKLEITSNLGYHNFLQISLFTPKFKASLPVINDVSTDQQKQIYKLGAMITVLAFFLFQKHRQMRNIKLKSKLLKVSFNRLSDQKSSLIRLNNDSIFTATQMRERQIKFRGLLIFKAFIGSSKKIYQVKKFINRTKKRWHNKSLSQYYKNCNRQVFKCGNIEDQLFDITQYVQSQVFGSILNNFKCSDANPCIIEQETPKILIFYWLRGQQNILVFKSNQSVTIGKTNYKDYQTIYFFKKILNYLF